MAHIVVLGAGSIGLAFAAVFADSGHSVSLAEPDEARRIAVAEGIAHHRAAMEVAGLIRTETPPAVAALTDSGPALAAADLVIEAGPERLDVKQAIFRRLLAECGPETVLATASSAMTISTILPQAADQARALVAHPVNPPSVLRIVELVPAPATQEAAVQRAAALFADAGYRIARLAREIDGFVLNRLQGAVLREAYRLVEEGVTDVEGVETVMRYGLGPRWALSGPFETAELNTPGGIRAHASRMGPAYRAMGEARGETRAGWSEPLVASVEAQRRSVLSEADLPARTRWRAKAVARLVALRDRLMVDADAG